MDKDTRRSIDASNSNRPRAPVDDVAIYQNGILIFPFPRVMIYSRLARDASNPRSSSTLQGVVADLLPPLMPAGPAWARLWVTAPTTRASQRHVRWDFDGYGIQERELPLLHEQRAASNSLVAACGFCYALLLKSHCAAHAACC
jgi:hypothetical protein